MAEITLLFGTDPYRVRPWRGRFLTGRPAAVVPQRLDDPPTGQPGKLSATVPALLEEGRSTSPDAPGWPATIWSTRDAGAILAELQARFHQSHPDRTSLVQTFGGAT